MRFDACLIILTSIVVACASPHGIEVVSQTEPLLLEVDPIAPCRLRVALGGHVYTFGSWVGCGVVRKHVDLPAYHDEALRPGYHHTETTRLP